MQISYLCYNLNTDKESIRDLDKAYTNFFNGRGFPKFKRKKKSETRFYSRYDKIYFQDNFVNIENIGKVKYRVDYDIDLGISQLAITNIDKLNTRNVNKTNKVKKLSKKLKRLQRQCSRKYIMNKKGESYQKTKNIAKLEKKIKKTS
ncbi:hypothetical protein [Clostridium sp. KNHs214]|uniref:hypothetical protein n=1 Tax=Clostridium sp. KNHs214 TaxID=1540257 RepID=UPI0006898146|nr:hypothetical protein [Clostridium sp. KNHs214]